MTKPRIDLTNKQFGKLNKLKIMLSPTEDIILVGYVSVVAKMINIVMQLLIY